MGVTVAEAPPTGTEQPPQPSPSRSPYPGLRPFTEEDHPFFFGREREAEIVAANLLSSRLTLLYGASGVGKSSVLLAGVVNSLREQSRANIKDEDAFNDFAVVVVNVWSDPQQEIAAAARAEIEVLLGRNDLPDPPDGAKLAEVLDHWSEQLNGRLLVVFDQFEEYFRYHDDELEAGTFDEEFPQAVNRADVRANFLLSIRDDELAQLDRFRGKIPSLFDNRLKIDHLSYAGAEQAIRGPIDVLPAEQRVTIAEGFVEAVLAECAVKGPAGGESHDAHASDAINAPALQLVLERLWRDAEEAGENTLTPALLIKLGGVEGIREKYVGAALDSLSAPEQEIVAKCFSLLAGSTKTKVAYPASVLTRMAGRDNEREVTAVLDKLCVGGTGRILNAVDTGQAGEGSKSYELFNADLFAEPVLKWQKEYDRRALRRKYRNRSIVLVTLVAVFAALAALAAWQWRVAKDATASAASVALASAAQKQLASHRDVALLLSLEAYHAKRTPEAESAVLAAFRSVQLAGVKILRGNQGGVTAVAFSEDGKTLAAGGSATGTVQRWDADTQTLGQALAGDHGAVTALAFSPDQRTLAAAYDDGFVGLWAGARTPAARFVRASEGTVTALAFDADGKRLATADSDGWVRVWATDSRTELGQRVRGAAMVLSADGSRLVTMSDYSGAIQIWTWDTRARKWRKGSHLTSKSYGRITALAYDRTNSRPVLATAYDLEGGG